MPYSRRHSEFNSIVSHFPIHVQPTFDRYTHVWTSVNRAIVIVLSSYSLRALWRKREMALRINNPYYGGMTSRVGIGIWLCTDAGSVASSNSFKHQGNPLSSLSVYNAGSSATYLTSVSPQRDIILQYCLLCYLLNIFYGLLRFCYV